MLKIAIVLLGLLLVLLLYMYSNYAIENFVSTAPAPPENINDLVTNISTLLTTVGEGKVPEDFKYIEDVGAIPNTRDLVLYLTSFSDKTSYNNSVDVYVPNVQKWNNFTSDEKAFIIITGNVLPSTIKAPHGLPLKNARLEGIRSDEIDKIDYTLKSFTATFSLKINNIVFDANVTSIEVFSISLESPNYVRLTIEKIDGDAEKVHIGFQIGGETNKSLVLISKSELTTAVTTISMVYEYNPSPTAPITDTSTRKLYVNKVDNENNASYTIASPMTLGNTRMVINKHSHLDANLHAFVYYAKALTIAEHKILIDYFATQSSGITNIVSTIRTMASSQLRTLQSLLQDQTLTRTNLQERLAQCITEQNKAPAPASASEFRYKITTDNATRLAKGTANLARCSILQVKERLTADIVTPAPVTNGTSGTIAPAPGTSGTVAPAPAPAPASSFPFNISFPFLNGIISKDYRT